MDTLSISLLGVAITLLIIVIKTVFRSDKAALMKENSVLKEKISLMEKEIVTLQAANATLKDTIDCTQRSYNRDTQQDILQDSSSDNIYDPLGRK
jgi:uncharacterized protein YlxW (UPF0749 family)